MQLRGGRRSRDEQCAHKVGENIPEFSRLFQSINLLFHRLSQQKVNVKMTLIKDEPAAEVLPTAVLHKYLNDDDELKILCSLQFFPEVAQNSLRIPWVFHVQWNPWVFQIFQVCGHPEEEFQQQQQKQTEMTHSAVCTCMCGHEGSKLGSSSSGSKFGFSFGWSVRKIFTATCQRSTSSTVTTRCKLDENIYYLHYYLLTKHLLLTRNTTSTKLLTLKNLCKNFWKYYILQYFYAFFSRDIGATSNVPAPRSPVHNGLRATPGESTPKVMTTGKTPAQQPGRDVRPIRQQRRRWWRREKPPLRWKSLFSLIAN